MSSKTEVVRIFNNSTTNSTTCRYGATMMLYEHPVIGAIRNCKNHPSNCNIKSCVLSKETFPY